MQGHTGDGDSDAAEACRGARLPGSRDSHPAHAVCAPGSSTQGAAQSSSGECALSTCCCLPQHGLLFSERGHMCGPMHGCRTWWQATWRTFRGSCTKCGFRCTPAATSVTTPAALSMVRDGPPTVGAPCMPIAGNNDPVPNNLTHHVHVFVCSFRWGDRGREGGGLSQLVRSSPRHACVPGGPRMCQHAARHVDPALRRIQFYLCERAGQVNYLGHLLPRGRHAAPNHGGPLSGAACTPVLRVPRSCSELFKKCACLRCAQAGAGA